MTARSDERGPVTVRRVAIVSDWFPPRRGGIEAQLGELAARMAEQGSAVDVITSTPGAVDGRGFRVRPLRVATLPGEDVAWSPLLTRALRRELSRGYDVVHAHVSVVSPVGWLGALTARSLGLPTVVTFHSVLRHVSLVIRLSRPLWRLEQSGVIWTAVSALVARQAGAALGTEVSVLPNGIDLAAWSAPRKGVETGGQPTTLVSTMRLQRKKRPRALARAFVKATALANTDARLVIIGDGPERSALERDIRAHAHAARSQIRVAGWLAPPQVRAAYAAADGFAYACAREAFGLAALEARASGLPVIGMHGGPEEFLTHGADALLCDSDEALTRALATFLADVGLRERLRAHPTDLRRFDWAGVLAQHEAAYRRATMQAAAASGAVAPRE